VAELTQYCTLSKTVPIAAWEKYLADLKGGQYVPDSFVRSLVAINTDILAAKGFGLFWPHEMNAVVVEIKSEFSAN